MLNKLNKQHLSQLEALILNKAADFGIQRYSGGTRNKRLPRILESAKNNWSPSLMLYKLHALYQVEKGPLKDEFSVSVACDLLCFALLSLRVLLLPFTVLLQNIHTTLVENGENLISAQP